MSYTHTSNWIDAFLHQEEGALFQFAGAHSLTANRIALEAAKQFIDEGRDPDDVRAKTGWFMGEDDCWRYEISDHDSSLKMGAFHQEGAALKFNGRLGQILDHPKLYAAYPFLAEIKVETEITEHSAESGGYRSASVDAIGLNLSGIKAKSSTVLGLQENLLHEIQHSIQDTERFGSGASSEYLRTAYANSLFDREDKLRKRLQDLSITPDSNGVLGREIDIIEAELTHLEFAKQQSLDGHWNEHFFTLYMNHGGEREARVTARDWQLTPAQRLEREPLLPQIPTLKPIITFNDMPYQAVAAELNLTPKANITLLPKETILKLTHAADRDTFHHECGHLFLRFEGITAQGRRPSEFQKKILDYLGVNSFADIKRVHDEKFARGFEQFMREKEYESKAPTGIGKIFETVKDWIGSVGAAFIETEEPLSTTARAMFEEMISASKPLNQINIDQAEKQQRLLAMRLIDTGIYERGEAYTCAQLLSTYALAKCDRDPDFPTVDRVFDQINLQVRKAEAEELKQDIKFDFHTFEIDSLVRDQIGRAAPPMEDHVLNQYDHSEIEQSIPKEKSHKISFNR